LAITDELTGLKAQAAEEAKRRGRGAPRLRPVEVEEVEL